MDSSKQLDETVGAKSFTAPEIKNAETGEVEAIVQTLGVVDRDHEVIPIDALPPTYAAKISMYDHDSIRGLMTGSGVPDQPPVGKGTISVEGDKLWFRGNYFMETQRGREAFLTFKAIGPDQEWSFGYRIAKADAPSEELKAKGARRVLSKLAPIAGSYEVSPVPMGGGLGTRTVAMKSADEIAAEERAATELAETQARERAAHDEAQAKEAVLTESAELRRRRFTGKR